MVQSCAEWCAFQSQFLKRQAAVRTIDGRSGIEPDRLRTSDVRDFALAA
jgi:hypothetical protein